MSDVGTSAEFVGFEENVEEEEADLEFSMEKLCPILCDPRKTFDTLVERGAIKGEARCSSKNCRRNMTLVVRNSITDGLEWNCNTCRRFANKKLN